ncbi:DUF1549 and DUF1553 domain-containing protein [Verrucomicrobiales bacterium BCK34]|nr:DUF1549 and DUF1553 domain-containing protein [Verrucomicrobiales bacterium BCK34]
MKRLSLKSGQLIKALAAVAILVSSHSARAEETPGFRRDIMPILFRAGCNTGTCHGAAKGKDGFMLSLFGYDPGGDYYRIVNEMPGRRLNPAVPEQSLLLKKATGEVPHTGGELFTRDSEFYSEIRDWIAAGAPDDESDIPEPVGLELSPDRFVFEDKTTEGQLKVTALYDDGSKRDVTSIARFHSNNTSVIEIDEDGRISPSGTGDSHVFARFNRFTIGAEVIVLPPAENFTWSNPAADNYIDEIVFDRLEKLRINPSELCDDETFLRRITLDLAARTPSPDEYHAFIADPSPEKRKAKIEELLGNDSFADLWTAIWSEQLRIVGGNYAPVGTYIKAADTYQEWIREQFRKGRPLNEFVADMVVASGSNIQNGPVNLYTMLSHEPKLDPKGFAADFSQVFLGIQIQCAECHNHPFDRWTMDDYYGFVSFFTGVTRKPGVESREQRIYYDTKAAPAKHLLDMRPVPAKTLGAVEPVSTKGDPRRELAKWLTSGENEHFSRNLANRIWAQLLGKGIVAPVDDMRVSNPPVNGPLLDALSEHLVASGFDLRSLVRDICNSRVYQLSSQPNATNKQDTRQFSRAYMRRLRPEIIMDSVVAITGQQRNFSGFPSGIKAIEHYPRTGGATSGPHFGDTFFETFGRSSRATVSSTELKLEPTLSQALHMSVGNTVQPRLSANGRLKKIVEKSETPIESLEELFILTLSRKPTPYEIEGLVELIGEEVKNVDVYEDIFWSLLNSTEFSFNQ